MGVVERDTITDHDYYYSGRKPSFSNEYNNTMTNATTSDDTNATTATDGRL
jgi:hypothetical protein